MPASRSFLKIFPFRKGIGTNLFRGWRHHCPVPAQATVSNREISLNGRPGGWAMGPRWAPRCYPPASGSTMPWRSPRRISSRDSLPFRRCSMARTSAAAGPPRSRATGDVRAPARLQATPGKLDRCHWCCGVRERVYWLDLHSSLVDADVCVGSTLKCCFVRISVVFDICSIGAS